MAVSILSATKSIESTYDFTRDVPVRKPIAMERLQHLLVIWLDNNMNSSDKDWQYTITKLRRTVINFKTFTNSEQCIEFINTVNDNKICIIVSGSLGQHIVPSVHNMSQVDTIFIFCDNKKLHEQWAKEWFKIRGVFTNITLICDALKQTAHQCEQNAISISFIEPNKKSDQLDPSFMYTQILKEILLTITFDEKHRKEFIDYCRDLFANNTDEFTNIKKFEETYRNKTPIYWYTCESFLYPMLNCALRLMDVDIIVRMGFFIRDLHHDIQRLHTEQFGNQYSGEPFTVYRGQGLSEGDFEQLKKTKRGLISLNNFLSTSKNRAISLGYAQDAVMKHNLIGILFIMSINPAHSTTPFASITDFSCFTMEDEVLFSMHTTFRIGDIKPIRGHKNLHEVHLTLTSDNDDDLRMLTNWIREEIYSDSEGWERLAQLLIKMGKSDKAQEVYEILLGQTTNESDKASIYHQLGLTKYNQGKYQEAIKFYEISLAIYKKTLAPNHPNLAMSYNNIGLVYDNMRNYSKALLFHEKALKIRQQTLPLYHPDLAMSYNNIGLVYDNMRNYLQALLFHEKALKIRQRLPRPNHPDLATSHSNIGLVYTNMRNYPQALLSYEKALTIREQSLLPNHPSLAMSHNSIGCVYDNMGNYQKALSSYEKTLDIQQQSLPKNHPDLAKSHYNIGLAHENMGNYLKAQSSYEHAIRIAQQSLQANHPHLLLYIQNFKDIKKKL
ncbi:unnamed protein product [Adineta steineri]|uniref:Kinesin light chain n=2 Tax=Adineta steineri TaxID=433720 RepID=A0A819CD81_9BILA|nr:unnamed protein product [Adineta steineri]